MTPNYCQWMTDEFSRSLYSAEIFRYGDESKYDPKNNPWVAKFTVIANEWIAGEISNEEAKAKKWEIDKELNQTLLDFHARPEAEQPKEEKLMLLAAVDVQTALHGAIRSNNIGGDDGRYVRRHRLMEEVRKEQVERKEYP